ncbi:MAG: NYN domain-containing protein [Actinobacteria bacterium]|nr:NYN domain-containing protein [Actinomycetota bacterium]MCB9412269.1 NYN domain-containing protein [Actinomycetota bacterium]
MGDPELAGQPRFAVLIDADNAQAAVITGLLAEVAKYGEATTRRIYGDFTSNQLASWKRVIQPHAIKPVQQFAYTTGKNATDGALIIDAMDMLYTGRYDGFCLVSSDSDFTGLALRLREAGLVVIGFGERRTPEAFRKACHRFVFTDLLKAAEEPTAGRTAAEVKPFPEREVLAAVDESADDSGWANLATVGSYLNKVQSDFDSRDYGYRKLSDLVTGRPDLLTVDRRRANGQDVVYVRRAR